MHRNLALSDAFVDLQQLWGGQDLLKLVSFTPLHLAHRHAHKVVGRDAPAAAAAEQQGAGLWGSGGGLVALTKAQGGIAAGAG
jgi:hypothetical protein